MAGSQPRLVRLLLFDFKASPHVIAEKLPSVHPTPRDSRLHRSSQCSPIDSAKLSFSGLLLFATNSFTVTCLIFFPSRQNVKRTMPSS